MKHNELKSWAKKELEHIKRALRTQELTDTQRVELDHRAAALLELRAVPWMPYDWGYRLIRTAPWLPTDCKNRLMLPIAVVTGLLTVYLHSKGFLGVLVSLLIWSVAIGCIHSPRMNAESRYALSRIFSRLRK